METAPLSAKPGRSATSRQYTHLAFASLTGLLLGFDLCVMGSLLTPVQRSLELCYPCAGGDTDAALAHCTCPAKGAAVSLASVGAVFGALLASPVADLCGRRAALALTDVCFALGAAAMACATPGAGTLLFFAGRAAVGAGLGGGFSTVATYLAETAPARLRGRFITAAELAVCVGCLAAYVAAWAIGDAGWRVTMGLAALPALLQLFGLRFVLCESPIWLAWQGRRGSALHALEVLGLEESLISRAPASNAAGGGLREALHQYAALAAHHRRPLALALGCALAHNATAANTVLYYSRDVLLRAGVADPLRANVAVGLAKAAGVAACLCGVDRVGRRALLVAGSAGCAVCHAGLAAAFATGSATAGSGLALAGLLAFFFAWNVSWASLMMVVAAEVLPTSARAAGTGAAYALYWLVTCVQTQTLEDLFAAIGTPATFALFAATSALALAFAVVYVPETRGRRLSECDAAVGAAAPEAHATRVDCARAASQPRAFDVAAGMAR